MSGFEVVGVVLGSIPLMISGLEHYNHGLAIFGRWKRYDREVKSLIRNLRIEEIKMKNICEKLLLGLVPHSDVEAMIRAPTGELWNKETIKMKVRERLSDCADIFDEIVREIRDNVVEMQKKLGLDDEFQVKDDRPQIMKQLKRVGFALSRSAYSELLTNIRDGITNLETLTNQGVELEPMRRERSQVKLISLLRDLSTGLYYALKQSLSCACKHNINLRLMSRSSHIMSAGNQLEIYKSLELDIGFSWPSRSFGKRKRGPLSEQIIEEVRAYAIPNDEVETTYTPGGNRAEGSKLVTTTGGRTANGSRTVRLLIPSSSSSFSSARPVQQTPETQIRMDSLAAGSSTPNQPSQEFISDLCGKLRKAQKQSATECYGFITDCHSPCPRNYRIHPIVLENGEDSAYWSTITLRQILQEEGPATRLGYKDKMNLAVVISKSVLQLYNTPWIPQVLTSSDIVFIKKRNTYVFDEIFVTKGFTGNITNDQAAESGSRQRDPTLLSLGFILIELLLGQDLFPEAQGPCAPIIHDYYVAAQGVLAKIRNESANYFSAVSRCLDGELHKVGGMNDKDFTTNVYSGIIALLQLDLDML